MLLLLRLDDHKYDFCYEYTSYVFPHDGHEGQKYLKSTKVKNIWF